MNTEVQGYLVGCFSTTSILCIVNTHLGVISAYWEHLIGSDLPKVISMGSAKKGRPELLREGQLLRSATDVSKWRNHAVETNRAPSRDRA